MAVDFHGAIDAAGFADDIPVVVPVMRTARLFAACLFKDFSAGAIQAHTDDIGSGFLDAVQALDIEGRGGNQRGDRHIAQATHAAGHIHQIPVGAVILHLGDAYAPDLVFVFGDSLSYQVGRVQGP